MVQALFIASVVYLLLNALMDPGCRTWALGIFAVLLAGIPVFHMTVGKGKR